MSGWCVVSGNAFALRQVCVLVLVRKHRRHRNTNDWLEDWLHNPSASFVWWQCFCFAASFCACISSGKSGDIESQRLLAVDPETAPQGNLFRESVFFLFRDGKKNTVNENVQFSMPARRTTSDLSCKRNRGCVLLLSWYAMTNAFGCMCIPPCIFSCHGGVVDSIYI